MVGGTEIDYSLAMIARARKRLIYQKQVADRLGFNSDPSYASAVRDMCLAMEAKLDVLLSRHADLVKMRTPRDFVDLPRDHWSYPASDEPKQQEL